MVAAIGPWYPTWHAKGTQPYIVLVWSKIWDDFAGQITLHSPSHSFCWSRLNIQNISSSTFIFAKTALTCGKPNSMCGIMWKTRMSEGEGGHWTIENWWWDTQPWYCM